MSMNRIQTRIKLRNDTLTNWSTSSILIYKGEAALGYDPSINKYEIRIGNDDAGKTWSQLASNNLTVPVANVIGLDSALYDYQLVETTDGTVAIQKKLHSLPDEDPTSHESNWSTVTSVSLAFTGTYNNDSTDETNYNPIALKDYVDSHVAAATTQYFEGTRDLVFNINNHKYYLVDSPDTYTYDYILVLNNDCTNYLVYMWFDNSYVLTEDTSPLSTQCSYDETDSQVLARITNGVTVKGGSTAVVKTAIPGTEIDRTQDPIAKSNIRYSYTAYTYDTTTDSSHPVWRAMDGNYNAKNVFLDEKIVYTTNVGTLNTITSSKTKDDFNCAGMSVYDALKTILSKTVNPTVTNPSYTLAIGTITTSAGSKSTGNEVEAGTTVTKVAWNGTFTDGTYSYKSQEAPNDTKANCVPSYSMSNDKSATATSETTEDGTYTLASTFTVEAPTAAATATKDNTIITISGNCSYAASTRTPYNNIQETVPSLKIPASSSPIAKSATATLKGYHNGIYFGGITSAKYTSAELAANPSLLRTALTAKNVSGYSTYAANTRNNAGARPNTFKFVAPTDTYTIVIAVKGSRTLSSAFNDSVFAEMASSFEANKVTGVTIPAAGEDAGTEYTIWTYSPVDRYSSDVKMSITMAG